MRFNIKLSKTAKTYFRQIVDCLVKYCGVDNEYALDLVNKYWADQDEIKDDDILFNEFPYYWAMSIYHHPVVGDNRPDWWKDPTLWSPPLSARFNRNTSTK